MLNDSYYLYVEVVAQRCSQLMRGAKPKIDLRAHKFSTVARQEVREELIPWHQATDEQLAEELAAARAAEQAATAEATSVAVLTMPDAPVAAPAAPPAKAEADEEE